LALVIEKEVKVNSERYRIRRKNGRVYEYEYGEVALTVPKEYVGRKAKVIVIIP